MSKDYDSKNNSKPTLFSGAWFKNVFMALNVFKYSAREWAIWSISSWVTIGQVFALKQVIAILPVGLVTFFKAVASKVAALVSAATLAAS